MPLPDALLGPRCKSQASRAAALALLAQLVMPPQHDEGLLSELLMLMGGRDLVADMTDTVVSVSLCLFKDVAIVSGTRAIAVLRGPIALLS